MANKLVRLLHPTERRVILAPEYLANSDNYKGYLRAPWDCTCQQATACTCHLRPTKPAPDQLEEARASLAKLQAGIEETELELGLRPPPGENDSGTAGGYATPERQLEGQADPDAEFQPGEITDETAYEAAVASGTIAPIKPTTSAAAKRPARKAR